MIWRIAVRPEVEQDVAKAAAWYEERQPGLGLDFVAEVVRVWDALAGNPLLNSQRHPTKNIRWRTTVRFPYRVIYEVDEPRRRVTIAAVLHAARHDRHWRRRF
jgi:plasmid stabilization system protein ParE